ncbi:TniQ family protein [Microbacterium sp. B2969]|uniref:TniQ family protein n=1 Tax=Microbacterium alkaliflavum TaxID=3248839 RepID=A0ABW7QDB1_9MICO
MTTNNVLRSADVRVLPFRVRPLPDEPFDSWVEALAAANRATIAEVGCALGLIEQRHGTAVSATWWMANAWATELTDAQAGRVEQATGIPAAQFQEMTRMQFARHAIRRTRNGRISVRCAAAGTAGRFCPECLADSGGRWRMSWQFPFAFACTRHRRILVDACPSCGRHPRQVGHPLAVIPVPGQCHNRVRGAAVGPIASRCRADLTVDTDRIPASEAVLHAQRTMMRVVSTGEGRFGIYADAPQPAVRVLEDVRLLSRAARVMLNDGQVDSAVLGTELLEHLRRGGIDTSWSSSSTSAASAAGTAIAIAALGDTDRTIELLRGRLAASTSYTLSTPQVQSLIAASFGRTRRPTGFLQSAALVDVDAEERARKVPAQLWDEWTAVLAPGRMDREIAASALAAAVVFAGTRLTHAAALALLDSEAPVRQVTNVMREFGRGEHEHLALGVILRLVAYLDSHEPPIDYARRRTLDCSALLPDTQWREVCRRHNVHAGAGRRHRHARAHLFRLITGNPLRAMPEGWDAADVTLPSETRFVGHIPEKLRADLNRIGDEFLAAHGIHEPLAWTPPLAPFDIGTTVDAPGEPSWPPARPASARIDASVGADSITDRYRAGSSTYELAGLAGVSRQTVSRLLADRSTPTRRGRPPMHVVDERWLRHQYLDQRLTIGQIASLVGCTTPTISRRLRDAGIPIRPAGSASEVATLHPHPLAGASPLLRRTVNGRYPIERARRFLIAARHNSIRAAATEIGTTQSTLSKQLARLSRDAGGPLLTAGARGRPMTLTPLGARLTRELQRVLPDGSVCLEPGRTSA